MSFGVSPVNYSDSDYDCVFTCGKLKHFPKSLHLSGTISTNFKSKVKSTGAGKLSTHGTFLILYCSQHVLKKLVPYFTLVASNFYVWSTFFFLNWSADSPFDIKGYNTSQ